MSDPVCDRGSRGKLRLAIGLKCMPGRGQSISWSTAINLSALVVAFVVLLATAVANAQQTTKPYRVGMLGGGGPPGPHGANPWSPYHGVVDGLRELGWVEGKNVSFDSRFANGRLDRLPQLARELVEAKVDVIVTLGSAAVRPGAQATRSIPVVMVSGSGDPVGDGLVKSLAKPGGNLTGVAWAPGADVLGKLVSFVKELIPGLSHVAVLADNPLTPAVARAWKEAGDRLHFDVQRFQVNDPADIEPQLNAIVRARMQAAYVTTAAATYSNRRDVANVALKNRLPLFSLTRELTEAGGLLSYGPNNAALGRRAAGYVDKILKGANPGDLPIDQPSIFQLVINLKTAKALGIRVPQTLLQQADEVIE